MKTPADTAGVVAPWVHVGIDEAKLYDNIAVGDTAANDAAADAIAESPTPSQSQT